MKEMYCEMCKKMTVNVHPKQSLICADCNQELGYLPTQQKLISVRKWSGQMCIVSYKPMPEAKD